MKTTKQTTRRSLLGHVLRGSVLAVFGGTAGHLLKRDDSVCVDPQGQIGCRACGQLDRCGLPQALSVKQFLNGEYENKQS